MPDFGQHAFISQHHFLPTDEIMVSEDMKVTGITMWECSGFLPRIWLTLKNQLAVRFNPHLTGEYAWTDVLIDALMGQGLEYSTTGFPGGRAFGVLWVLALEFEFLRKRH